MRFIFTFIFCLCVGMLYAEDEVIHVKVGVSEANPPICLEVTGNAEQAELIRKSLIRSDWFTVVEKRESADFLARFDVSSGQVQCRLYSKSGKYLGGWQASPDIDFRRAVFFVLDKIIETAAKNPGQCNSRIIFACGNGKVKEIYSCNFDGSDIQRLTNNGTFSTEPSWIPGSSSFVYTYYTASAMNIAVYNYLKKTHRRICSYPGLNSSPCGSPDGQRLAVCLSRNGKVDLYLRSLSGMPDLQAITNDSAVESSPTWNADQTEICFVSDKNGRPRLFIANVSSKKVRPLRPMLYHMAEDGGKGKSLAEYGVQMVGPSWSHVSNKIAYSVMTGGRYAIAVVDMAKDSKSAIILTDMPGNWEDPSWAPDGRHLVCTRELGGVRSLWQIDSVYGTAIRITSNSKNDYSLPSWGRVGK